MNKNIAITALILVLVCCIGVSLLGIAGLVIYRHYTSTSPAPVGALPTQPPVHIAAATATTASNTTSANPPADGDGCG